MTPMIRAEPSAGDEMIPPPPGELDDEEHEQLNPLRSAYEQGWRAAVEEEEMEHQAIIVDKALRERRS